jgi:hypothetical protein
MYLPIMPTGSLHDAYTNKIVNGEIVQHVVDCRCMIGQDHETNESVDFEDSYDDDEDWLEDDEEAMSVDDAADIWMSSGMDEDYTLGYNEDELRRSAFEN